MRLKPKRERERKRENKKKRKHPLYLAVQTEHDKEESCKSGLEDGEGIVEVLRGVVVDRRQTK